MKSNFGVLIILLFLLAFAVAVSVGVVMLNPEEFIEEEIIDDSARLREEQEIRIETQRMDEPEIYGEDAIDGPLEIERNIEPTLTNDIDFRVIHPNGGETICVGKAVVVEWKVPSNADTIHVGISRGPLTFFYENGLGVVSAHENDPSMIGLGKHVWIPNSISDENKINISGIVGGISYEDTSDGTFSTIDCTE